MKWCWSEAWTLTWVFHSEFPNRIYFCLVCALWFLSLIDWVPTFQLRRMNTFFVAKFLLFWPYVAISHVPEAIGNRVKTFFRHNHAHDTVWLRDRFDRKKLHLFWCSVGLIRFRARRRIHREIFVMIASMLLRQWKCHKFSSKNFRRYSY